MLNCPTIFIDSWLSDDVYCINVPTDQALKLETMKTGKKFNNSELKTEIWFSYLYVLSSAALDVAHLQWCHNDRFVMKYQRDVSLNLGLD